VGHADQNGCADGGCAGSACQRGGDHHVASRNLKFAAGQHRIAGVDDEVEQRRLELCAIESAQPHRRFEWQLDRNALAKCGRGERLTADGDRDDVELKRAAPRERENLAR
jgi:hypothetical protein